MFGGTSARGVEFLAHTMAEWASGQDQESASYFDGELFGDHATDIPEIFCLKINTKENEHVE